MTQIKLINSNADQELHPANDLDHKAMHKNYFSHSRPFVVQSWQFVDGCITLVRLFPEDAHSEPAQRKGTAFSAERKAVDQWYFFWQA